MISGVPGLLSGWGGWLGPSGAAAALELWVGIGFVWKKATRGRLRTWGSAVPMGWRCGAESGFVRSFLAKLRKATVGRTG